MENNAVEVEGMEKFILMTIPAAVNPNPKVPDYVVWNSKQSKVLIDLYKTCKPKVGTQQIRNYKKLREIIANEVNRILKMDVSPAHCENKWRVLERGYKRYDDNKNKTGRGRKYFEFVEEMDEIFKKNRNVHPEILLSTETIDVPAVEEPEVRVIANLDRQYIPLHETQTASRTTKRKNPILNRNQILECMRKERAEYYKQKLEIENQKLEIHKQKLVELKERNKLLKERIKQYIFMQAIICME